MAKTQLHEGPKPKRRTGGGKTFIDDEKKLKDFMKSNAKGFITKAANATARIIRTNIKEDIYDAYRPKKYRRTNQLLHAVYGPGYNGGEPTETIGDGAYQAEAGIDQDRMDVIEGQGSLWGQHAGDDGQDARLAVIVGFESNGFERRGKKGHLIYKRYPVHMMSLAEREIENKLRSLPKEAPDYTDLISYNEYGEGQTGFIITTSGFEPEI